MDGVTMVDLATALAESPRLVERHLGSLLPHDGDELISGTFVHVEAGCRVGEPLESFFGRDAEQMAAHSRTLIVAEAGSEVGYIEGCSAPIYTPHRERHSTIEIVVGVDATVRHTTIQNWSTNVENTIEKHARVNAGARIDWVDAMLGSRSTNARIVSELAGNGAHASATLMVSADTGQQHDVDVEMVHAVAEASSTSVTRLLGAGDGSIRSRHVMRGGALKPGHAASFAQSLRVDGAPEISHHADQFDQTNDALELEPSHIDYLMQRGLERHQAVALIVSGFIDPITRTLPMAYAVEWERLIELHLQRAIG